MTTTGSDLDHTVGTTRTPDSGSGGILEHIDALDVLGLHTEELSELLGVVHILKVDIRGAVVLEDITIYYDKGLLVTIDGGNTTQTHGSTGTKVTGIHHDIKSGYLTLEGLVGGLEGETLHIIHIKRLGSHGNLLLGDAESVGLYPLLTGHSHGAQLCAALELDTEHLGGAYHLAVLGVSDVGDLESVLAVLDRHREVTIDIGGGIVDNTIVTVYFHHVGHHHRSVGFVPNVSGNAILRHCRTQAETHCEEQ